MLTDTYKGVSLRRTGSAAGIVIEEQMARSMQGYADRAPRDVRIYDLGIFDVATAEWIKARLRQRFPELSEPLTTSEVEFIKHEIAAGTL